MKALTHFILIMIFAFPGISSNASNLPNFDGTPRIHVTIEFGRKSKDCKKFGICSITFDFSEFFTARATGSTGTAWIENGRLQVEFNRASMKAEAIQTYFDGKVLIEEDYELPKEIAEALGVSSYKIRAGAYPLSSTSDNCNIPDGF